MSNISFSTNNTPIPEKIVANWQEIANTLAEIIHVPAALIMRVSPPHIEVFVSSKSEGNPYEVGEKAELSGLYCTTVMKTHKSLLVGDALKDSNWNANPDIKLGMISYLGYPLEWPNGEIFGTICVLDSKPNTYAGTYQKLVNRFQKVIEDALELVATNNDLREALDKIQKLESILPICAACKKIRSQDAQWIPVDEYFHMTKGMEFSHGLCPDCTQAYFEEIPE